MNRRNFIIKTLAAGTLASLPSAQLFAKKRLKKITILHTNDQHSRIEPFEVSENKQYSNRGGFSRRATLIEQIRKEEKNVLLLDAGDIFQGTPYFNFYGGELEFKLMSKMGYDFSTLGNHDFDNGLIGLKKQLHHAKFDFLIANYDFSNTILEDHFRRYRIIKKDGVKIGIFGLGIELNGLVPKDLYMETKYLDPVEITKDIVKELKEEKCDLIICLSHLGFNYPKHPQKISDVSLAKSTSGIDLIIGGHTHTFLKKPEEVKNIEGKNVIVNQVGWAGLFLGRIDFYLDELNQTKKYTTNSIGIDAQILA